MSARIDSTVPVLASLDIRESRDFYVDRLGFAERGMYDDYLIVVRDGAEIHFWLCEERRIAEHTSCYVRTAGTDALFAELTKAGLVLRPPVVQPWGMKELYVIDPHGNLLKFGEPA
ncbi:MAG TPA: VOC family protein [Noviherbaspirillum sp.]|jgi:catechol 2,3-dioxygenase-like lactoylglutathione lyase family enzyme|uniref:bleomycin resistance protein n=1 Tax=Noviherbaspirillum sp. TaxID=1926288 RepID=UPI002F95C5F6